MSKGDKEFHTKAVDLAPVEPQTLVKVVTYESNNSGGSWWLTDENWLELEANGWEVDWYKDKTDPWGQPHGERWLGALASHAKRVGLSLDEAIAEWEQITGEYSGAMGCSCCGQPHWFYEEEEWR